MNKIELDGETLFAVLIVCIAACTAFYEYRESKTDAAAIAAGYEKTTVPGYNQPVWVKCGNVKK